MIAWLPVGEEEHGRPVHLVALALELLHVLVDGVVEQVEG